MAFPSKIIKKEKKPVERVRLDIGKEAGDFVEDTLRPDFVKEEEKAYPVPAIEVKRPSSKEDMIELDALLSTSKKARKPASLSANLKEFDTGHLGAKLSDQVKAETKPFALGHAKAVPTELPQIKADTSDGKQLKANISSADELRAYKALIDKMEKRNQLLKQKTKANRAILD